MKDLITVIRLELLLFWRGRILWLVALVMIAFGIFNATNARDRPWDLWNPYFFFVITQILTFITGDQIHRDRERCLDGVVWSTPVSTAIYVWGKYLTALIILFSFAGLELLVSLVTDLVVVKIYIYPSPGPWPFMLAWCLFAWIPLMFVAALTLLGITLTRGQRAVSYVVVILVFVSSRFVPDILNIVGSVGNSIDPSWALASRYAGSYMPAAIAQQVVHLAQAIPPDFASVTFFVNRLIFFSLALLLVIATVYSLGRQRQGKV